jgi:O-methyltransferase involved in polyketide biosynthesis
MHEDAVSPAASVPPIARGTEASRLRAPVSQAPRPPGAPPPEPDLTAVPQPPGERRHAGASAFLEDSSRISPTAHYTANVWVRSGLSDPALSTRLGAVFHAALAPLNHIYPRISGRPNLDEMLVARHLTLDRLLEREIAAERVGQVIELAAGLSGRGYRFARRFPALHYVETDLVDMAAYKRHALDEAGLRCPNHEVQPLDVLATDGPGSLEAVAADLLASRGLAIITEGLLSYLARDAVLTLWRRIVATLGGFPHGFYFSDLHVGADTERMWIPELFRIGLELFARGPVRYHFASVDETIAALRAAGFHDARLYRPSDVVPSDRSGHEPAHLIRVLAAAT